MIRIVIHLPWLLQKRWAYLNGTQLFTNSFTSIYLSEMKWEKYVHIFHEVKIHF
jgi:hypothetical protein